ncbi:MAG: T9SS type A sorting domain-containing protein [Chitinophagales bacterium]
MRVLIIIIFTIVSSHFCFAQTAPDITFTDITGQEHNLYETLDAGKTVLLDFFFVDCVPCQTWTPTIEELYQTWGGGDADVEFWAFSDVDDNSYIQTFADEFEVQYTLTGLDGGAFDVIATYASEFPFLGYPTYSVICPDRSITWDIWPLSPGAPEIDEKIAACGATGIVTGDDGPDQEILIGSVWPNPVDDKVFVPLNGRVFGDGMVKIFSAQGVLLKEVVTDISGETVQIPVHDLAKGMYVLMLMKDDKIILKDKFVKM